MNRQKPLLIWSLALVIFAGWVSTGRAQITWDWSYTSTPIPPVFAPYLSAFSGSGTLVTSSTETNGYYSILSISGTWSITQAASNSAFSLGTATITGLAPLPTADQLLSANGEVDQRGIIFALSNGDVVSLANHVTGVLATEFGSGPAQSTNDNFGAPSADSGFTINLADFTTTPPPPTPEPASWMLGMIALGLALGLRWWRVKASI